MASSGARTRQPPAGCRRGQRARPVADGRDARGGAQRRTAGQLGELGQTTGRTGPAAKPAAPAVPRLLVELLRDATRLLDGLCLVAVAYRPSYPQRVSGTGVPVFLQPDP